MKTLSIIIFLLLGLGYSSFAQDVIFRTNGTTIEGKIIKVTDTQVKYQKTDKSDETIYFIDKSKIIKIVYEGGKTTWIDEQAIEDLNRETIEEEETNYTSINDYFNTATKKDDTTRKLRKHIVYGEILGMSGFFSINYMPTIVSSPNGAFTIKARVGIGMSNKSVHFPHGILFGFGSANHQFEIGFQGAVIAGFANGDVFEFLHDDGKATRYSFSPTIGYRLIANNGFSLNINILMISAENASGIWHPLGKTSELTPWFGIGLGYAF